MKKIYFILCFAFFLTAFQMEAQGIAINTNGAAAHSSAMLDVRSDNKGVLITRVSSASRNAISNPAAGLLVYDTTESTLYMFDGHRWLGFEAMSDRLRPISNMMSPPDQQDTLFSGYSVSIWNDFAVVGAPYRNGPAAYSGCAYVYKRNGETWSVFTILSPSSGALDGAFFGASVNICGNYIIVGAPYKKNAQGQAIGAAYIFQFNGSAWIQTDILWGSLAGTDYGYVVEISETGTYAVVAEPGATVGAYSSAGILRVYNKGASWFLQASLSDPTPQAGERFGTSMALSPAGTYLVAGAPTKNIQGFVYCGTAIIFARSGILWLHHKTLENLANGDIQKGFLVDITNTNVLVVEGGAKRVYNYNINGPWNVTSYTYPNSIDGARIDPVTSEIYVWAPPYIYRTDMRVKEISTMPWAMGMPLFSIYNNRFVVGVPLEPSPLGIYVGGHYFGVVNVY